MKSKKASVNAAAAAAAKVEPTFKCDICEVDFNNEIPYNAHMVCTVDQGVRVSKGNI